MPTSDRGAAVKPPSARKIWLCLLLLGLFAPVVLAVGSAAVRPAWLIARPGGVPVSVAWVIGSMLIFIVATWLLAGFTFSGEDGEADQ